MMDSFPMASILSTEVRSLRSAAIDQEFLISVALPFYYEEHPEKSYPVIYVLDGDLYFGMVAQMVRTMNVRVSFCGELPDAIVVGIGYPPTKSSLAANFADVNQLRMRDFTPLEDEEGENFMRETFPSPIHVKSGGAHQFLQFIDHDLIPFVQSEYRADVANRTLMGHSYGGLFAVYALLHQPALFQRYVIVSADLAFGDKVTLDYAHQYAEQHDSLPARVYLAHGKSSTKDHEALYFKPFIAALESPGYADFTLSHQIFPDWTHCAVVAPAFQAGLLSVFG